MTAKVARIEHIATAFPAKAVSNEEIVRDFEGWTAEKIEKKLGIRSRHFLGEGETPADIAAAAAENLFGAHGVDRSTIDYLIFCTQSPDYVLPTTACVLQHRLHLPVSIGAIDINQGCSGYIHGLALAKSLVEAGVAGRVLLLTADAYSKLVGPQDASVKTIFGDGATATLIAAAEGADGGIEHFTFGTDGSGFDSLIVRNSGMRDEGMGDGARSDLYMDGPAVLNFTLREVPPILDRTLAMADLTYEDVDKVILHQANKFILSQLMRKAGIPADKMVSEFADFGNTVSSTIPIAIERQIASGGIERGDRLLLAGFGVGLSWGACLVTY